MKTKSFLVCLCLLAVVAGAAAQTVETNTFPNLNRVVPDGNGSGVSATTNLTSALNTISSVKVKLNVAGEFNGDLYVYIRHLTASGTNLCVLLNRPGRAATNASGYADAGLNVTFDQAAANGNIHTYRTVTNLSAGTPLAGTWQPDGRTNNPFAVLNTDTPATSLTNFNGMDPNGEWTLFVADLEAGGTNMLVSWELQITGSANQAPTLAAISNLTTNEDAVLQTVNLTGIAAGGGASQSLSVAASSSNTGLIPNPTVNYTSPNATGSLTFTPVANAFGTATITVIVSDDGGTANGGVDKVTNTFTVTINGVNDVPSFTKGANQTVNEDATAQTVASWATAISKGPANESAQVVNFIVSNNSNSLFSVQPAIAANGTLTYTPAANAFGTATVTVQIHDDGGVANSGVDTSVAQTFSVTINAVNDVPSFTKGANQSVNEDAGARTVVGWATAISAGPANESAQVVSFSVSNNSNSLFSVQPAIAANGTLTYTPATNTFGSATISVTISDSGGTANGGVDTSPLQTFTITINEVNDPPVASPIFLTRSLTNGVKTLISNLLTNGADGDGDVLTVATISNTSTNGGTVTTNGTFVTYQPPTISSTNIDSFSYTISDGRGGSTTNWVIINPPEDGVPSPYLTMIPGTNSTLVIRFDGIPNLTYRIQSTTNIVTPNWQFFGTNTANAMGIFQLTVTNNLVDTFYRSVYP